MNAQRVGKLLLQGARELQRKHDVIGDVRGTGLMIGIEFVRDRATKEPYHGLVPELERAALGQGSVASGLRSKYVTACAAARHRRGRRGHWTAHLDEVISQVRVPA